MNMFYGLTRKDFNNVYAHALMSSTFVEEPRCPKCKMASRKRMPPLVIEWDYGSSIIGDFTWPQVLDELVVTDRVKRCFVESGFTGVRFESVEMIQKRGLKRPRKESKASKRVWLPYLGPPLWNIVVTSFCNMDLAQSGRSLIPECENCSRKRMIVHDPASPLVVRGDTWEGADFFCIREMYNLVFVSKEVKQVIEERGFTNVEVKERGYIGESNGALPVQKL